MSSTYRIAGIAALLWCWVCAGAQAQDVQVQEEPRVSELIRVWVADNRANPKIEGWRVQIMASTDRRQVEDGRTRFRVEYPEVSATVVQEQPYYKLRVGAFRSRQEALAFIRVLEGWPGAYPAIDNNIHPRDFLEQ
ncbi:MAG: SPOR domain-containing protein [Chitinophagales bacterium]|nr:SPOR domain-containing protein [Chitinophagales bacterium]